MILPYPVSANRYWRNFRGRTITSAEANRYKNHVRHVAYLEAIEAILGNVGVEITLHPKITKGGSASKTVMDLDNAMKITLDSLQKVAYIDDRQIKALYACYGEPVQDGAVTVSVTELEDA